MMNKRLILSACVALGGCASSPPPAMSFAPLDYSYLPPITLKVADVRVVDNFTPTPAQAALAAQDPAPPQATLLNMLRQRLVASGQPGQGTVAVQVASVDEVGGNLTGTMTVDIHLSGPDGHSSAFTEASVSASQTMPDADASADDRRAALYQLTKRLMTQMNVQLQYEIQRNMPSWVVWSNTGAPASGSAGGGASGAIQSAPLTAPAASAPAAGGAGTALPAGQINHTEGVPDYLPGAGPAALQGQ